MNHNNTKTLTEWVIDKIKSEYKDDIAILAAVKGHAIDGDEHGEVFDYFVPATERGYELSQTFMIDGIGHDLYPRSWERMEKTADLDEMTITLANAEILYAKSDAERERFEALRKKLEVNLHDSVYVYRKALVCLEAAMELYRVLLFEEKNHIARTQGGCIHMYLSQAVAYLNHTFTDSPIYSERQAYDSDEKSRMYHCPGFTAVPEKFFENAGLLLRAKDGKEQAEILHALICATRKFILERKPEPVKEEDGSEVCYQELADWYQELSLTWRRIRYFCRENMPEEAYVDACNLQSELLVIAREFQIEEMNLLDSYSADCLERLAARSIKLEENVRRILEEHGIAVNEYASMEEFLAGNHE